MKLLMIDDHPMLRSGLAAVLAQAEPQAVIWQAADAQQGLDIAGRERDLDAILLDLVLPGMDGFDAIKALTRLCPAVPIVVISSSERAEDVRRAFGLGARGYIMKSASPHSLLTALHLVLAGELYVPPGLLAEGARCEPAPKLTDRQAAVMQLLSEGLSNKEIANTLDITEKTVKVHVGAIFRVLAVVNRTQAVNRARRARLIAP
jgi:DNA-binding NarL/FixJ family response regulator